MKLLVQIKPNANKNELLAFLDNKLHIKIAAEPKDGKANKELIDFLSSSFEVPKSAIRLLNGDASRLKRIEINADDNKIMEKLKALGA